MRHAALLFAFAVGLAGTGCDAIPGMGAPGFTTVRPTPASGRASEAERPDLLTRFGGEVAAPALRRYVADLGAALARTRYRRDASYRFTVLDSPEINAFALPGGSIYVTRGVIALASDEAELAAVLAHELAHEETDANAAPDGRALAAAAVKGEAIDGNREGPRSATASAYSRDEEFAADARGIHILANARFDPDAMPRILAKLRARARLEAKLRGESPESADASDYLASHPAPLARLEQARRLAAAARLDVPIVGRDAYLDRIDGLAYGDTPAQGIVRGRLFTDAALRVAFEAPDGFQLFNAVSSVIAYGPGGARIVFDRARNPEHLPPLRYLTEQWGARIGLGPAQAIEVNGTSGATAVARGANADGPVDVRLVALAGDGATVFRMVFVTPRSETQHLAPAFKRATYSFTRLSPDQAAHVRGRRLRVVTVEPADTVESLAARMAFPDYRRERFGVLNGLAPDARLAPGMRVKLVTE